MKRAILTLLTLGLAACGAPEDDATDRAERSITATCALRATGNGVQVNGVQANGLQINGLQTNGVQANGLQVNGMQVNGMQINGSRERNGLQVNGARAGEGLNGVSLNRLAVNGSNLNGGRVGDGLNGVKLNGSRWQSIDVRDGLFVPEHGSPEDLVGTELDLGDTVLRIDDLSFEGDVPTYLLSVVDADGEAHALCDGGEVVLR